jgi:thiol-disulfide isomerase/thioredoxin
MVFLIVGVVAAVGLGIGLFTGFSPVRSAGPPETGGVAPPFSLPALNGAHPGRVGIPADGGRPGRPVVLLFFASWCPPCRGELPELAAAYRTERAEGGELSRVKVIGIDGMDTAAAARAFIDGSGVTFPVGDDSSFTVTQNLYGFLGDPAAVFVSGAGAIEEMDRGAISPARFEAGERRLLGASG